MVLVFRLMALLCLSAAILVAAVAVDGPAKAADGNSKCCADNSDCQGCFLVPTPPAPAANCYILAPANNAIMDCRPAPDVYFTCNNPSSVCYGFPPGPVLITFFFQDPTCTNKDRILSVWYQNFSISHTQCNPATGDATCD
jgi:hypothetical protein